MSRPLVPGDRPGRRHARWCSRDAAGPCQPGGWWARSHRARRDRGGVRPLRQPPACPGVAGGRPPPATLAAEGGDPVTASSAHSPGATAARTARGCPGADQGRAGEPLTLALADGVADRRHGRRSGSGRDDGRRRRHRARRRPSPVTFEAPGPGTWSVQVNVPSPTTSARRPTTGRSTCGDVHIDMAFGAQAELGLEDGHLGRLADHDSSPSPLERKGGDHLIPFHVREIDAGLGSHRIPAPPALHDLARGGSCGAATGGDDCGELLGDAAGDHSALASNQDKGQREDREQSLDDGLPWTW